MTTRSRRTSASTTSTTSMPSALTRVVVLGGDGIGPEVMAGARSVLEAVNAPIDVIVAEIDRTSGLPEPSVFDELDRGAVLLKAPMATPIGAGHKSPNVTLRKLLELYANVRPSRSIPGLPMPCGPVDILLVRENIEDLYAGVEHAQTADVFQCLKLISRSGSEAISRVAFNLADALDRRNVTCVTKANIMKLTDGAFLDAYRAEAARRGADSDHVLVDAAACYLVTDPSRFDVIVTSNLYGDILSDLAAGLTGGLGLAPSMNLGARCAMFEPVHGSAPDIAGLDRANPTAMILSAALMLRYLGDHAGADAIQAAIDEVYAEAKMRTLDVAAAGAHTVGCAAFAAKVAEHAATLRAKSTADVASPRVTALRSALVEMTPTPKPAPSRRGVGVDVFVEWEGEVDALAELLQDAAGQQALQLHMITNRGLCVWPAQTRARMVDHFRCRFLVDVEGDEEPTDRQVLDLVERIGASARWMHLERLQYHDGNPAFSAAYGARA